MDKLLNHPWTGNVRELRNFIERLYILSPEEGIDSYDLIYAGLIDSSSLEVQNFRAARAQFERGFLIQKLNENRGNISRTAESIGLERSYLHRKMKNYGLDREGEKES